MKKKKDPKDVWISFHSVNGYDDEEPDSLEFFTDGQYLFQDQVACLSYQESEVTGLEGTRTSVTILPDQVVVDRAGTVQSRMIFKEGSKSSFLYSTPFGQATMGVDTRSIRQSVNEHGGKVEIDYVVDMEHAVVARNRFSITIQQMGE
ncbi:MAG: DUF1934 domain-containing protein [Eubacteriales bacterium]|nr:DUF1934 domain-containing protein [Eubacteriales bacterium]